MNRLKEIKERFERRLLDEEETAYLLQRLERYETLIKQVTAKSQILASHCAYCADSGRSIDAHNTFEKTQEIYELLRDGLKDETHT